MYTFKDKIDNLLRIAIVDEFENVPILYKLEFKNGKSSDYQFNLVHLLAKSVKLSTEIAADRLNNSLKKCKTFKEVYLVKNGSQFFVCVNIFDELLETEINTMFERFDQYFENFKNTKNKQKILIDYSSPNIAKNMHIGHLRSTILGESLAKLYELFGHEVLRINHIGDWGTPFGMLIAYLKSNKITEFNIEELMDMYKLSRSLFDSDPEFKKRSQDETVLLQNYDLETVSIWNKICEVSFESFDKIYQQLNISLTVQGESFYQERMKLLMNDSTVNKHIKIDQGMKIMFIENNKTPLILQKSDSAFTYDTSDLAAIKYRLDEEKVDQIIYVVDSSQSLHFELLFKTAINLKWITGANQLKHVGFGLILGEDGKKLKSRSGHSVKLQDVIDEVYEYAYETMKKKIQSGDKHHLTEPEIKTVSKKIAINSIKYFDLHNPRLNSYKFDIKNMLSQKGDTALYLMYTLGRCKGINRKIKILDPDNIFSENLDSKIITTNSQARRLILKLLQFQEPIIDSINQLSPHHLCTYLYDLTQLLTSFYETVICIETVNDKIHIYNDRVKLINMSINMIEKYFDLLGLESVEEL